MTERQLLLVVLAPGALALVWILAQVLVLQHWRAGKVGREWAVLAPSLGLKTVPPDPAERRRVAGALQGTYRGRAVTLEAGIQDSNRHDRPASEFTVWTTAHDVPLKVVHQKVVDRLLPNEGVSTGDAKFDRNFQVEGDAEQAKALLTPAVRDAIWTYVAALGGFSLLPEGLRHQDDALTADPERLRNVLDWQAHVLEVLRGKTLNAPPPRALPRPWVGMPYLVALVVFFASLGGGAYLAARANKRQAAEDQAAIEANRVQAEVGQRVVARYLNTPDWYPAVVVTVDAGGAFVVYQDGRSGLIADKASLRPDSVAPGTPAQAPWDGKSYPAKVERRVGDAVFLKFEDGVTAWRRVGQLALAGQDVGVDAQPYAAASQDEPALARWKDEPGLYPASVVERADGRLVLVFHDGGSDSYAEADVQLRSIEVGEAVEVRLSDGTWNAGTVKERVAHAVEVELASGGPLWTSLSRVRVKP